MAARRFEFRFEHRYRVLAAVFGVRPENAYVDISDEEMTIRFGPWQLRTPVANIVGAEATGPYRVVTTVGPAHLSLTDRGITFATNPQRGLCIRFGEPVPGIEPSGRLRHPAATVTVADIDGLRAAVTG
jgi:hypothetical protein